METVTKQLGRRSCIKLINCPWSLQQAHEICWILVVYHRQWCEETEMFIFQRTCVGGDAYFHKPMRNREFVWQSVENNYEVPCIRIFCSSLQHLQEICNFFTFILTHHLPAKRLSSRCFPTTSTPTLCRVSTLRAL